MKLRTKSLQQRSEFDLSSGKVNVGWIMAAKLVRKREMNKMRAIQNVIPSSQGFSCVLILFLVNYSNTPIFWYSCISGILTLI